MRHKRKSLTPENGPCLKPNDPKNPLCDVYRWVTVSVSEVLKTGERGRCVECKMPVRAHRASVDAVMAAHFEHLKINPKCSRSDSR
jgi:hypothetical protein